MDVTWGAMVAFSVASTVLSGILTVQVYAYHVKFPKDDVIVKGTVWIVFILELVHNAFVWLGLYDYLVTHYADLFYLITVNWRIIPVTFFQGTLTCTVQLFYARRCWLLNRKQWILPLLTVILSLAALGAAYYAGVYTMRLTTFISYSYKPGAEIVWMGGGGLADILIIVSILSSLRGPRTGFKPLDRGLKMLSLYVISTGALTTAINFVTMALFYSTKGTLWYIGASLILSRLYSISLMTSLNLRGTWTRDHENDGLTGTPHHSWFKSKSDPAEPSNFGTTVIEIKPPMVTYAKYVDSSTPDSFEMSYHGANNGSASMGSSNITRVQ